MTTTTFPITIDPTPHSRLADVDWDHLEFGEVFADHMLEADYVDGEWQAARIRPFGALELSPSITSLHYGIAVFEGMKARKSPQGLPLLFRLEDYSRRLNRSAARLAMPSVPAELFMEGLKALVRLDADWIANREGYALYLRPHLFSTDAGIPMRPAKRYKFHIFTSPVGPYFERPVSLVTTRKYVRAFPGGTGDVKASGNYAAALVAAREAQAEGYTNVLWLDGLEQRYIEECGIMNVFFVIGKTVITPAAEGTVLPGITRASAIALLHEMGVAVEERRIAIDELLEAHAAGLLREAFGTGTAAMVAPISRIRHEKNALDLPPVEEQKIALAVRDRLRDIMRGRVPDPFGWILPL